MRQLLVNFTRNIYIVKIYISFYNNNYKLHVIILFNILIILLWNSRTIIETDIVPSHVSFPLHQYTHTSTHTLPYSHQQPFKINKYPSPHQQSSHLCIPQEPDGQRPSRGRVPAISERRPTRAGGNDTAPRWLHIPRGARTHACDDEGRPPSPPKTPIAHIDFFTFYGLSRIAARMSCVYRDIASGGT